MAQQRILAKAKTDIIGHLPEEQEEANADVQENNKEEENQKNKNKEEIKEGVKPAEEEDRY